MGLPHSSCRPISLATYLGVPLKREHSACGNGVLFPPLEYGLLCIFLCPKKSPYQSQIRPAHLSAISREIAKISYVLWGHVPFPAWQTEFRGTSTYWFDVCFSSLNPLHLAGAPCLVQPRIEPSIESHDRVPAIIRYCVPKKRSPRNLCELCCKIQAHSFDGRCVVVGSYRTGAGFQSLTRRPEDIWRSCRHGVHPGAAVAAEFFYKGCSQLSLSSKERHLFSGLAYWISRYLFCWKSERRVIQL